MALKPSEIRKTMEKSLDKHLSKYNKGHYDKEGKGIYKYVIEDLMRKGKLTQEEAEEYYNMNTDDFDKREEIEREFDSKWTEDDITDDDLIVNESKLKKLAKECVDLGMFEEAKALLNEMAIPPKKVQEQNLYNKWVSDIAFDAMNAIDEEIKRLNCEDFCDFTIPVYTQKDVSPEMWEFMKTNKAVFRDVRKELRTMFTDVGWKSAHDWLTKILFIADGAMQPTINIAYVPDDDSVNVGVYMKA